MQLFSSPSIISSSSKSSYADVLLRREEDIDINDILNEIDDKYKSAEKERKTCSRVTVTETCFDRFQKHPKLSSFSFSEAILTSLGLSKKEEDKVRVVDYTLGKNGIPELVLIHYIVTEDCVSHIRGLIYDVSDKNPELVCSSFPYTPEYNFETLNLPEKQIVENMLENGNCISTVAIEGTILRVFYWKSVWYISTHKRIDCRKSTWCKAKFFESFVTVWGSNPFEFLDGNCFNKILDRNKCYIFLLQTPENRILTHCSENKLCYSGYFNRDDNFTFTPSSSKDESKLCSFLLSRQKYIYISEQLKISNFDQLEEKILSFNPLREPGILLLNENKSIKIFVPEYVRMLNLRGGESGLRLRYFQLINSNNSEYDEDKITEFKQLYKDEPFNEWDKKLSEIPRRMSELYRKRYNAGDKTLFPAAIHLVLKETYNLFINSKSVEENIRLTLEEKDAQTINMIYKYFRKK